MKVVFSGFASPLEAVPAEVSGVDELSDDVLQPVNAAAESTAARRAAMIFVFILISFLYVRCFNIDYSPEQQSGTSDISDELLSVCSLSLQQSGISDEVASLSLQQSCVAVSL